MKQMRHVMLGAALSALSVPTSGLVASPVRAQAVEQAVWIQIEAKNSRAKIEERMGFWAENLPNISGFAMTSGWYAVALGPYSRAQAEGVLIELRISGAIPSDSYIVPSQLYTARLPMPQAPSAPAPAPQGTPFAPVQNSSAEAPSVVPAPVQAQAPAPVTPPPAPVPAPAAAVVEETVAQARASEAALSREERMELQRGLAWAGVYSSGVDGAFGPGTRGAMSAWQQQQGLEATGVLTQTQRAQLLGAWKAEVKALGLELVRDEEAGIEVQLPLALVAFDRYGPPFAHYGSKGQSGLQVWLISQPGDARALADLYQQVADLEVMPKAGARDLRANAFEIEGHDERGQARAWAQLEGKNIKGFLVVQTGAGQNAGISVVPRVAQLMRQSFSSIAARVLDPGMVPLDASVHASMMAGVEKRAPRKAGSGFFVDAQGGVMTAASLVQSCGKITLDGGVEAKVERADMTAGAALLRPIRALSPKAIAEFAPHLPALGTEVSVSGYSFGTDLPLPSTSFGKLEALQALDGSPARARLDLPAMAGDLGGAVLGENGQVIGILKELPKDPSRQLPDSVSYLAPSPQILSAVAPNLKAAAPRLDRQAPEDLTEIGHKMAVQVLCWH